jgi:hypothetical protein
LARLVTEMLSVLRREAKVPRVRPPSPSPGDARGANADVIIERPSPLPDRWPCVPWPSPWSRSRAMDASGPLMLESSLPIVPGALIFRGSRPRCTGCGGIGDMPLGDSAGLPECAEIGLASRSDERSGSTTECVDASAEAAAPSSSHAGCTARSLGSVGQ